MDSFAAIVALISPLAKRKSPRKLCSMKFILSPLIIRIPGMKGSAWSAWRGWPEESTNFVSHWSANCGVRLAVYSALLLAKVTSVASCVPWWKESSMLWLDGLFIAARERSLIREAYESSTQFSKCAARKEPAFCRFLHGNRRRRLGRHAAALVECLQHAAIEHRHSARTGAHGKRYANATPPPRRVGGVLQSPRNHSTQGPLRFPEWLDRAACFSVDPDLHGPGTQPPGRRAGCEYRATACGRSPRIEVDHWSEDRRRQVEVSESVGGFP